MSAVAEQSLGRHVASPVRWLAGFALVLGLHLGVGWVVLRHLVPPTEPPAAPPDALMLDLAPEPTPPSPEPQAEPQPPAPAPAQAEQSPPEAPQSEPPAPEPPVSEPPPPEPPPQEAVTPLPEPPPPPPVTKTVEAPAPRKPPVRPAPPPRPPVSRPNVAREPERPVVPAAPQAAPAPSEPAPTRPAAPPPNAIPNWRSELIGRLQQAKRYPEAARERGEQGVATVRLTMDRSGHVLSARLLRGSGLDALDQESLAMIHRADPLPPMPAELAGDTLTLTIPVTFSLR